MKELGYRLDLIILRASSIQNYPMILTSACPSAQVHGWLPNTSCPTCREGSRQPQPLPKPAQEHPPRCLLALLTYLVAQHPLQPVLPGSGQVDGQCWPAVLHHHHRLGQEVVGELHHHLPRKRREMASALLREEMIHEALALSRG